MKDKKEKNMDELVQEGVVGEYDHLRDYVDFDDVLPEEVEVQEDEEEDEE